MARFRCTCGAELSNSNQPEIQFKVFSDEEWLRLMGATINDPVIDIKRPQLFYWECPNCGRLHMFKDKIDHTVAIYRKES